MAALVVVVAEQQSRVLCQRPTSYKIIFEGGGLDYITHLRSDPIHTILTRNVTNCILAMNPIHPTFLQ